MSQCPWSPAAIINGSTSYQTTIEMRFGFLPGLRRMGPGGTTSYVLWHYPSTEEFAHPKSLTNYLQCAGTAQRMTLELRATHDNGEYTHWILGRGPLTGDETEEITWDHGRTMVHPEEVWTAEQAAPLFEQYARERTIPDWVHRRVFDI